MSDRRRPAEVTIERLRADYARWDSRLDMRTQYALGVVMDAWQAIADEDAGHAKEPPPGNGGGRFS